MYDITKKKIVLFYQFINNMLTEKDFCDNDTYTALCELGISHTYVRCLMDKGKLVIHLYDAQKWLREEKGIIVGIINNFTIRAFNWYVSTWEEDLCRGDKYVSYEEALAEGIKEALNTLK